MLNLRKYIDVFTYDVGIGIYVIDAEEVWELLGGAQGGTVEDALPEIGPDAFLSVTPTTTKGVVVGVWNDDDPLGFASFHGVGQTQTIDLPNLASMAPVHAQSGMYALKGDYGAIARTLVFGELMREITIALMSELERTFNRSSEPRRDIVMLGRDLWLPCMMARQAGFRVKYTHVNRVHSENWDNHRDAITEMWRREIGTGAIVLDSGFRGTIPTLIRDEIDDSVICGLYHQYPGYEEMLPYTPTVTPIPDMVFGSHGGVADDLENFVKPHAKVGDWNPETGEFEVTGKVGDSPCSHEVSKKLMRAWGIEGEPLTGITKEERCPSEYGRPSDVHRPATRHVSREHMQIAGNVQRSCYWDAHFLMEMWEGVHCFVTVKGHIPRDGGETGAELAQRAERMLGGLVEDAIMEWHFDQKDAEPDARTERRFGDKVKAIHYAGATAVLAYVET